MRKLLLLLLSFSATLAHAKGLIMSYDDVMRLSPMARTRYMNAVGAAVAEFDNRAKGRTDTIAVRGPMSFDMQSLLGILPEANAADGAVPGKVGLPLFSINSGGAMTSYTAQCAAPYAWSPEAGTCVLADATKNFKGSFANYKGSCPAGHKLVAVGYWMSSDAFCVSDDAMTMMSKERATALAAGSASSADAPQSSLGEAMAKLPGSSLSNALASSYGSASTFDSQKNIAQAEGAIAKSTNAIADAKAEHATQIAGAKTSEPPPIQVASLQAGEDSCAAYRCDPSAMDKKASKAWRKEWKKAKHSECSVGGMVSKYRNGKVAAGNCELISSLKVGDKTVKCKANETLCNPALYCKPGAKGQDSVFCVNPKKAKGQVQASCKDQHHAAWAGKDDAATSCIDNNGIDGLRELYTDTVNHYNDLCFSDDKTFRSFFCSECDMLSQRIQNANRLAFKKACLVGKDEPAIKNPPVPTARPSNSTTVQ